MLSDYLQLIDKQRVKQPLFPKDYKLIYLPQKLITAEEEYNKLLQWPNAFLCNVVYRPNPLFSSIKDNYYYEFIDIGAGYKTTFEDWRYFYIPLSYKNRLIQDNILNKINYYDVSKSSILEDLTITTQLLVPYERLNNFFFSTSSILNTHLLIPNFLFTGFSFLNKQGLLLYEYKDTQNYADDNSITYYSDLIPNNFYMKSSTVKQYAIEQDPALIQYTGSPPSKLYIQKSSNLTLDDLRFTGQVTNNNFSPIKKWYEYNFYTNNQPFTKIILPYSPTNKSLDFVKISMKQTTTGFKYNNIINAQLLTISQTSRNTIIKIYN